jgi:hypothetical protein
LLIEGNLFRTLRASNETQDEIDAHLGVTQPGQPNPDPSPVLKLVDYVEATWTGGSKICFYLEKKLVSTSHFIYTETVNFSKRGAVQMN